MTREPIYAALFALLKTAAGFNTASRQFKHFSDVNSANQPALFLVQRDESVATVPGMPSVSTMSCDVLVYVHTGGDKNTAPASILNPLLDAVFAALAPSQVTGKQTLGGLVQHCWIEGRIETDEGLLQQQGYALIPVSIKAV